MWPFKRPEKPTMLIRTDCPVCGGVKVPVDRWEILSSGVYRFACPGCQCVYERRLNVATAYLLGVCRVPWRQESELDRADRAVERLRRLYQSLYSDRITRSEVESARVLLGDDDLVWADFERNR